MGDSYPQELWVGIRNCPVPLQTGKQRMWLEEQSSPGLVCFKCVVFSTLSVFASLQSHYIIVSIYDTVESTYTSNYGINKPIIIALSWKIYLLN